MSRCCFIMLIASLFTVPFSDAKENEWKKVAKGILDTVIEDGEGEDKGAEANSGDIKENDPDEIDWKTFSQEKLGFKISYPGKWTVSRPKNVDRKVVFKGKINFAKRVVCAVRKFPKSEFDNIHSVVGYIKKRISRDYRDADISAVSKYHNNSGKLRLWGRQFKASYSVEFTPYKQWVGIFSDDKLGAIYAFTYVTPSKYYQSYMPLAQRMLDSFKLSKHTGSSKIH